MILVDSDIIIDFLNGDNYAIHLVNKYYNEICTSEINKFEILNGIYNNKTVKKNEIEVTKQFFENILIFPFEDCANIAAKISSNIRKKGKTVGENDIFIASIMIKNKIPSILTNNKKHFKLFKNITIKN